MTENYSTRLQLGLRTEKHKKNGEQRNTKNREKQQTEKRENTRSTMGQEGYDRKRPNKVAAWA